jgi:PIN domain nuclease of toxin-antitoxin system
MADDARLSPRAREFLADRAVSFQWSAASTWELAIKASIGKVALGEPVGRYLASRLVQQGIDVLPISQAHSAAIEDLPLHHRDPFDRMLVAQSRTENLTLLTGDPAIAAYDVAVAW